MNLSIFFAGLVLSVLFTICLTWACTRRLPCRGLVSYVASYYVRFTACMFDWCFKVFLLGVNIVYLLGDKELTWTDCFFDATGLNSVRLTGIVWLIYMLICFGIRTLAFVLWVCLSSNVWNIGSWRSELSRTWPCMLFSFGVWSSKDSVTSSI